MKSILRTIYEISMGIHQDESYTAFLPLSSPDHRSLDTDKFFDGLYEKAKEREYETQTIHQG